MAIEYVNRRGETYYLHEGTRADRRHFFFSKTPSGTPAAAIPEGYEVHEKPGGQVLLRRRIDPLVTPEEFAAVEDGIRRSNVRHFILELQPKSLVVHTAEPPDFGCLGADLPPEQRSALKALLDSPRFLTYTAVLRFSLVDRKERRFQVERWCFRGGTHGWIFLRAGELPELAAEVCPHLGRDSFFDLM